MSDSPAAAPGQHAAPPLTISAQYIKDFSFENPNAPDILRTMRTAPQVKIGVDVRTTQQAQERTFEVVLKIKVDAKIEEKTAFIGELDYAAVCALDQSVKNEHYAPLLYVEVPRQLFPFARQILSAASQNAGYPPLFIQTIDFATMFRRQLDSWKNSEEGKAAIAQATKAPADASPA